MTAEERWDRLEHDTAAFREERRQQREEDLQLLRDTQRKIDEFGTRVTQMGAEFREADRRLGDRIEEVNRRLGERIEEVDRRLAARIDALTVAIG